MLIFGDRNTSISNINGYNRRYTNECFGLIRRKTDYLEATGLDEKPGKICNIINKKKEL